MYNMYKMLENQKDHTWIYPLATLADVSEWVASAREAGLGCIPSRRAFFLWGGTRALGCGLGSPKELVGGWRIHSVICTYRYVYINTYKYICMYTDIGWMGRRIAIDNKAPSHRNANCTIVDF